MTDISYKNWNSMSDNAIVKQIGAFIKHQRMEQNKTQAILANAAGISRSTLSILERGETVTLATLIRVLRILDVLYILDAFVVHQTISPLLLAKIEKDKRKRASGKN
jgi:transcriptional regulator with XRE-family HTH domain